MPDRTPRAPPRTKPWSSRPWSASTSCRTGASSTPTRGWPSCSATRPDDAAGPAQRARAGGPGRSRRGRGAAAAADSRATAPTSTHVMKGVRRDGSRRRARGLQHADRARRPAGGHRHDDRRHRAARARARAARRASSATATSSRTPPTSSTPAISTAGITSLNRAGQRLTGLQRRRGHDDARGRLRAPAPQRALVDELIQRQVRERQDVTAEFEVVTRQGERRVLEVSTSPDRARRHAGRRFRASPATSPSARSRNRRCAA